MNFNFPMQAPQPPSNQVGFQPQMPSAPMTSPNGLTGIGNHLGYQLPHTIQMPTWRGPMPANGGGGMMPGGGPNLFGGAGGSGMQSGGSAGGGMMLGNGGTPARPGPSNVAPYGYAPNGSPYGNMSHTQIGNPLPSSGGSNPYGGGQVGGPWQFQNPYYSYNPNSGMGGPNVNPNQFAAQGGGSGYTSYNQSPFGRYSNLPLGMQQRF